MKHAGSQVVSLLVMQGNMVSAGAIPEKFMFSVGIAIQDPCMVTFADRLHGVLKQCFVYRGCTLFTYA